MSTATVPIRSKAVLKRFRNYYKDERPNIRNYCIIAFGLNSALRISDMLNLRWEDIYNFHRHRLKNHLQLTESKTHKLKTLRINSNSKEALHKLFILNRPQPSDYVFTKTTDHTKPLSRSQAYRIVTAAAHALSISECVSCHSLRKTFGYQAWKQGVPPELLMDIFNHSSYEVTKRYLGITQDEKDDIYQKIEL